jgi:hypothetical protein
MTQTHGKTRYKLAHGRDQSDDNEFSFMINICGIQKVFTCEAVHHKTYSTPASCRWGSSP